MSPGAPNLKMGRNIPGIVENESASVKHQKLDSTPLVPLESGPGAPNMKLGPDALGIAKNESERAKLKNGT
jgi:hypothetical protein